MAVFFHSGPHEGQLNNLNAMLCGRIGDCFAIHHYSNTVMLFKDGKAVVHAFFGKGWPDTDRMCELFVAAWIEHLLTGETAEVES